MATTQEISAFFEQQFLQAQFEIISVENRTGVIKKIVDEKNLRPGNTISGLTLFTVADPALYTAVLGEIGIVPLAVTTNMSIHFLRKPKANTSLIGRCTLTKVGRSLITGQIELFSEGESEMVAHAMVTYAIPPKS